MVAKTCLGNLRFVVLLVNFLDSRAHNTVVARNDRVFKAKVNISLLIDCTLKEAMRPSFDILKVVGSQHPGVAFVQRASMKFNRVAA